MAGLLPQPHVTAHSYFFSAVFILSLVNIDCDGGSWAKSCAKIFDLNATQEYILVVPIPTVLPRFYRCPHPHAALYPELTHHALLTELLSPAPCAAPNRPSARNQLQYKYSFVRSFIHSYEVHSYVLTHNFDQKSSRVIELSSRATGSYLRL